MKATKASIDCFLSNRKIAIAGVSRDVVAEAMSKGIDNIWIQQMSDTPAAIELTRSHPVNLITGECILMHTDPVTGIHKFHRSIMKLFGKYPR